MQITDLHTLTKTAELNRFLESGEDIRLYGAGYYLNAFLQEIDRMDRRYLERVKCIMVSDMAGNPTSVRGIPVMTYQEAGLKQGDLVLLTLGKRFVGAVCDTLIKYVGKGCIFQLDFNMFHEKAYRDVKKSIQPLIDRFPEHLMCLDEPVPGGGITAWTCWWQGEEQAPEIVKACMESQRRNLPDGVRHVVITQKNYKDYIVLPEYIMDKVESGDIGLPHLADIIRVNLLYKYGGFWMDAEVFVLEPLPETILDYPIYTRNLPETQYYADAMWGIGFMYAQPGNKLFRFLSESLFYYFSVNQKLKYYFTLDYMIAVACNLFPDIKAQLDAVPYNNDKAFELERHLSEPFEQGKYDNYVRKTYIQFLSHKVGWLGKKKTEGTIYEHILKSCGAVE